MAKMKALGRKIPTDWKHVEKYPYAAVAPKTATKVEVSLPLPYDREKYDQGSEGACVGFGSSWMMSILNHRYYDAVWLWNKAKEVDGMSDSNPGDNNGTTVAAAMDVLRKVGHSRILNKKTLSPDIKEGILENRWATNVDQIRTALKHQTPVTIGINWYTNFDNPVKVGKDFWIGQDPKNLGPIRDGHSVCIFGASDKLGAVKIVNNWGNDYPLVYMPYETLRRLLKEDGEATLVTDRPTK